jgi:predicted RecA/RadA family phage recombinase
MATNYISNGNILDYVAASDIKSGQLVIIGAIAGVALTDIAKGATGAVQIYGIWELDKAKGEIVIGAKLYWDNASMSLTTIAKDNAYVGVAIEAATASATSVKILLNGRNGD